MSEIWPAKEDKMKTLVFALAPEDVEALRGVRRIVGGQWYLESAILHLFVEPLSDEEKEDGD